MSKLWQLVKNNRILTLVILTSVLVRFVGLIPNIDHTDEAYIIEHSRLLFYNIVTKGDFDPQAYKYGSLIFYLQALVYLPFYIFGFFLTSLGFSDPPPLGFNNKSIDFVEYVSNQLNTVIFAMGRGITAIFGVGSVLIIYLLGKNLFSKKVGILSAFILAINPFHVRDSHYITTDVPLLFSILLALILMTRAFQTSRLKWYLLSGLVIGISATIKYFPLTFLAYPIAVLMDSKKDKIWIVKVLAGVIAIPFGIFLGAPFLFFSEESRQLFQYEVGAQFLWYGTTITAFLSSLAGYVASFGKSHILPLATLIPTEFTEFHSAFLIFKVFGPILFGVSILGAIISFFRSPGKTLFLLVIPMFTFVYISLYVPAVFERLSLPVIPFLCIFSSIFFAEIWSFARKRFDKKYGIAYFLLIFSVSLFYPVTTSFASSWSCGVNINGESREWIKKNISESKRVAVVSPVYLPDRSFREIKEVRPDTEFFLSELQEKGFDYLLINTGIFTRFIYQFDNDFFMIPKVLYENYYLPLSITEYNTRVEPAESFVRHNMCDLGNFIFYKIPEKLDGVEKPNKPNKTLNFDSEHEVREWNVEELESQNNSAEIGFTNTEGHKKLGALEYSWNSLYYRGPTVSLPKIFVSPGEVYTFSGWVKSKEELDPNQRDGFLRMDFYREGDDVRLPGRSVALSPRTYGSPGWRRVGVTTRAPQNSEFAVLSIQVIGTKNVSSFYFDDIEFSGEK